MLFFFFPRLSYPLDLRFFFGYNINNPTFVSLYKLKKCAPAQGGQVFAPMLTFVEHPHDKVRVFVDFTPPSAGQANTRVKPVSFFWAGRRYDVASVNLVYRRKVGKQDKWCFAVSDTSNTFVLSYEPVSMEWMLDEVQGT